MLEDARTALGTVEPLARFGSSAFGPLRARAISANGVAGDWMPLGTLVRLPAFKELRCPHSALKSCILTGTNLFLVDSISSTEDFANPTEIPSDFTGAQFTVPHPVAGVLYLKLRDDPSTVQTLNLPVTPMSLAATTARSARSAGHRSACRARSARLRPAAPGLLQSDPIRSGPRPQTGLAPKLAR